MGYPINTIAYDFDIICTQLQNVSYYTFKHYDLYCFHCIMVTLSATSYNIVETLLWVEFMRGDMLFVYKNAIYVTMEQLCLTTITISD